jgi:hypothetical protein
MNLALQLQNPLVNALAAVLLAGFPMPSATPMTDIEPANVPITCKYPEVSDFFSKLAEDNPRRNLDNLGEKLTEQDFFCINEIADEEKKFYQASPYCLSQGNVKFVTRSVREAIKVAKRCTRE